MYWDFHGRRFAAGFTAGLPIFFLLLLAGARLGAAEAAAPTCVLLTIEGKVDVAAKGTPQWRPGRTNQPLQIGDRLRTGLRSRATLRWSDLSIARVDELTSIEIQPPEKAAANPQLDLRSGASYFFSRERPDSIGFRTPVASGAIRGTEFNLAVEENGRTVLTLIDGEVTLRNDQDEVVLKSGEQGVAEAGRAPTKTAVVDAINIIQWALYYPMVIDPGEIRLADAEQKALQGSFDSYRSGDVLGALNNYADDRLPQSDAERVYLAALSLAVGQVDRAQELLKEPAKAGTTSRLAAALNELIATVKNQPLATESTPTTASEWMARSYYLQSKSRLEEALDAARAATEKSTQFGAAWVRVAELEFGFGRADRALEALDKGLELAPRHAHGHVVRGFALAARDRNRQAEESFENAITLDGALSTAWLGRGLMKIRRGEGNAGREDLQVAATLEPHRAIFRSYLGKAFSHTRDTQRAHKDLELAKKLDANDPTAWLYSALLKEQENRVNEAIHDLEISKDLNENRSVFRSRLLLDQDQAVRSANLAAIYRDAGMFDFAVQEAARAVNYDYANYSAHLFLANSYDYLRDPKLFNLRYETPWYSEWLVANLLAPPGAGTLSQNISQQEYTRLFDTDGFGLFSRTDYFSSGDWVQSASQYGYFGKTGYSLDAYYRSENGQRPNNDLEQINFAARLKHQLTPQDSLFFQVSYYDAESGDISQYFDQSQASRHLRVTENQVPNVLLGYHRQWSPSSHTLFLAGRFDDTLTLEDRDLNIRYIETIQIPFPVNTLRTLTNIDLEYESELEAYSAELQHLWRVEPLTFIVGGRYQTGWSDTETELHRPAIPSPIPIFPGTPATNISQSIDTDLNRISVYGYTHWEPFDTLRLTAGVSYDRLHYPENIDISPVTDDETTKDQLSPKAGLVWSPLTDTHLRAAYAQSLGGVFFDTSVRLEPTQIAGVNQAFRSLIPESVMGLVPGTRFETWGVGLNQRFPTRTYVDIAGEWLKSSGGRSVGIFVNPPGVFPPAPSAFSSIEQDLDFSERSLIASVNQLVGKNFVLAARYRRTYAELESTFEPRPTTLLSNLDDESAARLDQLWLAAIFNHSSGVFGQFNTVWSKQDYDADSGDLPGDDFWQYNVYVGYRFLRRRGEVTVGLLNLTDRDYRLHPLTLYNELPRERTFVASLKFYF